MTLTLTTDTHLGMVEEVIRGFTSPSSFCGMGCCSWLMLDLRGVVGSVTYTRPPPCASVTALMAS